MRRAILAGAAIAAIAVSGVAQAQQESAGTSLAKANLIRIDHPGAGRPMVDVALPAGMFDDVRGLIDAALTGVLEALQSDADGGPPAQFAAQHVAAVREVTGILEGAIEDVHIQVYGEAAGGDAGAIADYYAGKLSSVGWDQVVRARDGDESAAVFLLRQDGAVRGVFVVAGEDGHTALVNAACDISPQRLKDLTRRVTKLWLELGGRGQLQQAIEHMPH
ncbi:MAG: hypothetical protein CMJ58_05995 [Planctomycetaceae bacterium]|nr:hypothetical protein [Planctomycetaceae bacterium]